ncbi:MAG: TatD family hydrolase [Dehalococcoidales bacterium]|nr:MAG: TatD family hydrolase [Dehalococcoidales bacterium]
MTNSIPSSGRNEAERRPDIIDTHAHLDMETFNSDRAGVISRAQNKGVSTIITVGMGLESSNEAIKLAESNPGILVMAGFHPHQASQVKEDDIESLVSLSEHPKVVAIGETGLDFYRNYSPRETQLRVLEWQLELAVRLDLPVVIHCRQAEKDILPILHNWTSRHHQSGGTPRGVVHCFNNVIDMARQYLNMDFFVSLGAYIGYPSSGYLHDVIRYIPNNRLIVETDCPFLPPQAYRGKRNEPAYITYTVDTIAGFRGETWETIAIETTRNARQLFAIPQD